MLCLADAHCHLDAGYFPEGPEAVLERARDAGVVGFVVVGLAAEVEGPGSDGREPVALPSTSPAAAPTASPPAWASIRTTRHAGRASCTTSCARWPRAPRSPRSARLASTTTTTTRRARRSARSSRASSASRASCASPSSSTRARRPSDTLAILEREGARDVGGIIHCFSEDRPFAERALALGFDLSFSGIVTFKSARAVQEVAAWAPLDRILVETDSPYLAPVPMRGKRCEPAYVVHTARRVAELRGHAAGGARRGDPRQHRASLRTRLRASVS